LFSLASILAHPTPASEEDKIGVAVTIPPLAKLVEEVGGERVRVFVLIPPGADPRTYELKPGQLEMLGKVKVFVRVGSGLCFENELTNRLMGNAGGVLLVNASEGIKVVGGDPHVWLSPRNAIIMVENIYRGLAEADPEGQAYYAQNKEKFQEKLLELDREIVRILSKAENRRFIVYHPAWGYFARDYGLTQIPIEREGKEPTMKSLIELVEEARKHHVKLVFASPEFNPKVAELVAREIEGRTVYLSPLDQNYVENLRRAALEIGRG